MEPPPSVSIVEVGLRDGLQRVERVVPCEDKLRLLAALYAAGLRAMEVTSFVSSAAFPQFADAEAVARAALALPGLRVSALIPNLRGLERAHTAGIRRVTFVVGATDRFNRENVRMSVEESLAHLAAIIGAQRALPNSAVEVGIAVAFGCPFTGPVPFEAVRTIVDRAAALGAAEVGLGDTIGVATPPQVHAVVSRLRAVHPTLPLSLHVHDTRGLGLANVRAGMGAGVRSFDASVAGLGGCPGAPGATGNIATEDLNHMLQGMGIATLVDQEALLECGRLARAMIATGPPGPVPPVLPDRVPSPGPPRS